jgi:predicted nucleic acid-binding protein
LIVLDASVLIAQVNDIDAHHERATVLLLESLDEEFGASAFSLAEAFVGPIRTGRLDQARLALQRLNIESIALGGGEAEELALLRASTELKLPDCCVLLAAEKTSSALATFDAKLASVARERGLVVRDR